MTAFSTQEERLRADFERAQLSPSVTMRRDLIRADGDGGDGLKPTERQLSAKARFDGAMAEAGDGLSDILWLVACACAGMPEAERDLGWPARNGKLVFKLALNRVADFYRIKLMPRTGSTVSSRQGYASSV